jgi:hypothetical protein
MQKSGAVLGIEGPNGSLIYQGDTCRDGIASIFMAALALRDPAIGREWLRMRGFQTKEGALPTLEELESSIPPRASPMRKLQGLEIPVSRARLEMEARFFSLWGDPSGPIRQRYSEARIVYIRANKEFSRLTLSGDRVVEDHIPDGEWDKEDVGWTLLLTRRDGQGEEKLWLRASNTEPGVVRQHVDARTAAETDPLWQLFAALLSPGTGYHQPMLCRAA